MWWPVIVSAAAARHCRYSMLRRVMLRVVLMRVVRWLLMLAEGTVAVVAVVLARLQTLWIDTLVAVQ